MPEIIQGIAFVNAIKQLKTALRSRRQQLSGIALPSMIACVPKKSNFSLGNTAKARCIGRNGSTASNISKMRLSRIHLQEQRHNGGILVLDHRTEAFPKQGKCDSVNMANIGDASDRKRRTAMFIICKLHDSI